MIESQNEVLYKDKSCRLILPEELFILKIYLEELGDGSHDGAVSKQDGGVSTYQGEVAVTADFNFYLRSV